VSPVAIKIVSADVYHRRDLLGGDLKVGIGYEQRDPVAPGPGAGDVRGFVEWARLFQ
jgi:hypothetical protein